MLPLLMLLFSPPAIADDDPEALVEQALAAHPDLAARRARVDEMAAMVGVARAWDDPMLEVMVGDLPVDSWKFSREPMAGVEVTLSQMLPSPGSTRRAGEIARADRAMADADTAEAALGLGLAVESAYWRLALVGQQRTLYERHLVAAAELQGNVRRRYEVGETGQSSVVRLDLLVARLEQEIAELGRMSAEISAELGRALGDPTRRVAVPAETSLVGPPGDAASWLALATTARPMLAALDAEIAREEARAGLARSMAAPEVTVYAAYRFRFPQEDPVMGEGSDLFSTGVMVPLPVSSAHVAAGERDAALAAARGARARRDGALLEIEADLTMIHAAWTRAAERAREYEERLLPTARKARDVTAADYRVGKADFEALYMSEVELLELEREARAAVIETRIRAAEAYAAIGAAPGGAE